MGKAQTIFIRTMAAVGGRMEEPARVHLVDSFQTLTNIAVQLIEENSYLRGRLAERPTEGPRSYLAVASATSSSGVSSGGTGGAAGPTRVDVLRSPAPIQKPALLIYPTHPKPNSEYSQVVEALRAEVSPEELGLSDFETRRIKGGALISSTSGEGIDKLEHEINTRRRLKEKLQAKKPFRRNPQLLVKGISASTDDLALKAAVINQNQLTGTSEDIKVVRTFANRDGTKSVVLEVTPAIFQQLQPKRRLFVGWTACPMEENLHVLFCRRCTRYGHTVGRCQERPRCMHCGDEHLGADCDGRNRRNCLACEEHPQVRSSNTNTEHSSSDADCTTYQWYLGRLRQK
ncbi:unnamed protein product [Ixodes persulcatus]